MTWTSQRKDDDMTEMTKTPTNDQATINRTKRKRHPFKVYQVALGQMRISQALAVQREFRQAHADKLAADLDLDKLGLPIVNHRDSHFWVCDGQHRIAALKLFGFSDEDKVDCVVYENLSDSEMAELFLGRRS